MSAIVVVLVAVFVVAILVWANARHRIIRSGVPKGLLLYQDADRRHELARPLFSQRYGLTGKPDYLIETAEGIIPIEIKSRDCPSSGPNASDAAQVIAYCLLVEAALGSRPPRSIIQYADRSFEIEFTQTKRARVQQITTDMRQTGKSQMVHRSHEKPSRCRACGFRNVCEERLE